MIDNLPARRPIAGEVDFTMMYAADDAFSRHLDRIAETLDRDGHLSYGAVGRWTLFAKQLHIHHTAEDTASWPRFGPRSRARRTWPVLPAPARLVYRAVWRRR
jgi:hypothetical protein